MSPLILSRFDCRPHFTTFLLIMACSTLVMGVSLLFPSLSFLSIPSLVLAGGSYGLGVGPVPFVLMSSLFPQKYKSVGITSAQITRSLVVCIQLKVEVVCWKLCNFWNSGFSLPSRISWHGWSILHSKLNHRTWSTLCLFHHSSDKKQINLWTGADFPNKSGEH